MLQTKRKACKKMRVVGKQTKRNKDIKMYKQRAKEVSR